MSEKVLFEEVPVQPPVAAPSLFDATYAFVEKFLDDHGIAHDGDIQFGVDLVRLPPQEKPSPRQVGLYVDRRTARRFALNG